MVRTAAIISALALAISVTGQAAPPDTRQVAARQLQGGWALVGAERDGRQLTGGDAQNLELSVRGKLYMIAPGSSSSAIGQFRLAQGKWPNEINFTPIGGPDAGQTYRGIYDIKGDIQRVCFAHPGQPRPTNFKPVAGSGQTLYVWQRGRPTASRPTTPAPATLPFDNINYTQLPPTPLPDYRGYPRAIP